MSSNQSVNLNDLLNFTLPPREARPPTNLPRRSRKTAPLQGVWNKERFINAQYRFVMNPTGDYTVHFADPDIFFQWHDILQVIIPRSSALACASAGDFSTQDEGYTTCPICLAPPTAPRMTQCGHVFCFPCILHYLSTSDNKWARCPICFDSVHERQLKSVKWYDGPVDSSSIEYHGPSGSSSSMVGTLETTPEAGSSLRMRLVQRPQITTLALPRSHTWPSDLLPPHQAPFHFLQDVFNFAKFMLATPDYLVSNLTRDLEELAAERRNLFSLNDTLSLIFIDAADSKVREQIAKAAALETPLLKEKIERARRDQQEILDRFVFHRHRSISDNSYSSPTDALDVPHDYLASRANGNTTSFPSPSDSQSRPSQGWNQPRHRRNVNPPPPSTSTYYYYQAASGLPLFLHPLEIRILLSHFNSYSAFPDTVTVRVESISEGTVNDDLRKRCKYLGHMPEGADVIFVEADLEGVVGTDGVKNFEAPLKMRSTKRKEKGKKEDRAKQRAEERERSLTPWSSDPGRIGPSIIVPEMPKEDFSALDDSPVTYDQTVSQLPNAHVSGAWGPRSFASALHSSTPSHGHSSVESQRSSRCIEDEWDIDVAWHELEQRSGGVGRKKRGNKLVVLGSGGGGARRR